MNNKDILSVLNSHKREILHVELDVQKDCSVFFDQLVDKCYTNPQFERAGLDSTIRYTLNSFRDSGDSLEFVNPKGRFLKRFGAFYKRRNESVLSDSLMGVVGDILQQFANSKSQEYWIDFTDIIDWKDGEFGKSGSCWWGMYAGSIPTFQNNGGWCIRFYDKDKKGIGRTWLYPHEDVLLGFNAYGTERPAVSKVIKKVFLEHGFELHYKTCEIENSQNSEIPYINSGTGFLLAENLAETESEYDLDMKAENAYKCSNCGELGNEDDYIMENDNWYCSDCHGELFSYCEKCDETFSADEIVSISHKRYSSVCKSCASDLGFLQCSKCEEYHDTCIESDEGNFFCENCNDCFYCESCDSYLEGVSECAVCVEQEEAEEDEDLVVENKDITIASGTKFENIKTFSNVKFPGLSVIVHNAHDFGILHDNTKYWIYNGVTSLKDALQGMEMFGALGDWNSVENPDTIWKTIDKEKAQTISRYLQGKS